MPVLHEAVNYLLEGKGLGPTLDKRYIIDIKRCLQLRMLVKMVQDNVGRHLPLEDYHNPHPCSVRLIIDIGNSFQLLFIDKVSYPLDHLGLVDHVGDFGDHNALSSRVGKFNLRFGPDNNPPYIIPPVGKSGPLI